MLLGRGADDASLSHSAVSEVSHPSALPLAALRRPAVAHPLNLYLLSTNALRSQL